MSIKGKPAVERIAEELFCRLQLLTASGYAASSPVVEVIRPKRLADYTPKDWQVVMIQGDSEEVPEMMCPGNPPKRAYVQTFNVYCHLMPSEKDTTPIDYYANMLQADVVNAITSVGAQWMKMQVDSVDLAIDTTIQPPEEISADGGADGFMLPVEVLYRVNERNPYQVTA